MQTLPPEEGHCSGFQGSIRERLSLESLTLWWTSEPPLRSDKVLPQEPTWQPLTDLERRASAMRLTGKEGPVGQTWCEFLWTLSAV